MPADRDLAVLEERIGYVFTDKALLKTALTHTSFANEHGCTHNERMEFLGDAVLETVSSDLLYHLYPEKKEGELTRQRASLVCEQALAACAAKIGLPAFLRLGAGEEMTGGRQRDSIVSDAMEAVIGAVFLDGGFSAADAMVRRCVLTDPEGGVFKDSKTLLQEAVQERGLVPVYIEEGAEGKPHCMTFYSGVSVDGKVIGHGSGHSKKAAEMSAARDALSHFRKEQ